MNQLLPSITCPHCWHPFPPEQLHYIATTPELSFDHRLPGGAMRRFLPSQFTLDGDAIDPGNGNGRGGICTETACPECHLKVPRLMSMRETLSLSIFGAPSGGKSYLLAAMTHCLSETLNRFRLMIKDADAEANVIVHEYERAVFQQPTPESPVTLPKTDLVGDWYSKVQFGGKTKTLPKPFLFQIDPLAGHPAHRLGASYGSLLCVYDNAGEHFEPGMEKEENPVTRHMASAQGLLFVFDPTQETRFREACSHRSQDPQWADARMSRQTSLFGEAVSRIQRFKSLLPTDRIETPLIVILPKFDAWNSLANIDRLPDPWRNRKGSDGLPCLEFAADVVKTVSQGCRQLLQNYAGSMLASIESSFDPTRIFYVPVSATGCGPSGQDPSGRYYHRFGDIKPMWAEVPLLMIMHQVAPGLLPAVIP